MNPSDLRRRRSVSSLYARHIRGLIEKIWNASQPSSKARSAARSSGPAIEAWAPMPGRFFTAEKDTGTSLIVANTLRSAAHNPSVRILVACESVLKIRSAGLVRDLRPFVGPHPACERNEKPQVSDEPCATGIRQQRRKRKGRLTDRLWAAATAFQDSSKGRQTVTIRRGAQLGSCGREHPSAVCRMAISRGHDGQRRNQLSDGELE